MSIVPFLLNDLLDDCRPSSIFDQNFGLGILSDDLIHPCSSVSPLYVGYRRPWRHQAARHSGASHIISGKDGFKVNLDVQQFKPDEISVKVVDDYVVVEGKHEEKKDEHGFISRQFTRRYLLPDNVQKEALQSNLSSDGVLTIAAPKKEENPPAPNERVIQIVQTNKPAIKQQNQQTVQPENKGDSKMEM